nr:MAG TPA: hypothetical protein [Caudoviricetes sp.]
MLSCPRMKPEQKEFRPTKCGQILRCFLENPPN